MAELRGVYVAHPEGPRPWPSFEGLVSTNPKVPVRGRASGGGVSETIYLEGPRPTRRSALVTTNPSKVPVRRGVRTTKAAFAPNHCMGVQ